ncbi:LytR/AlgR family response regulator transcription factor [Candidatus Contubernalis alkaliaceticus]|uniref:LytR/AlgR family response regulator transcription factor n=1 Tax=Candidatus Contubernalis alkaliaceticus TaxID=338645 RepID=UPI001F4BD152|nr:LytTR family DNA-binding domain-containing protein [Candidatus Contubernalis alkalaceticus]UNC91104.1 LytTR family transcriptional regulator DNA-binding domain-containing protein [Candidatus Contubernalis alkalaceticus]
MLNMVVLDTLNQEDNNISSILKKAYVRRELPIKSLAVVYELLPLLQRAKEHMEKCNVFIASFSRITQEYLDISQSLRRKKENVFIIFVVNNKTDISFCVRPSVRPAGILFIPLDELKVYQTIKEIYMEYMRIISREKQPVFTIKCGGEYFSIDTEDISFFEGKGKKIAVKTRGQEILFYSNFSAILEQLPDWFIRCHKGYVVNTKQIVQASFTSMNLTLKDKCTIPISRTYRDDIKVLLNGKGV